MPDDSNKGISVTVTPVDAAIVFRADGEIETYVPALEHIGYTGWLIWLWLIILVMGPSHAVTLDMVTELDGPRRWIGYAVLLVFVLTFVPVPLRTLVF